MRKLIAAFALCLALGAFAPLTCLAAEPPADGTYSVDVELGGGSGKSTVESPAALEVEDGAMTATVVWSSSNYDLMVVDGEEYRPVTIDGGSTFEIPVAALDEALPVSAETTAMSTPHMIDYTLTFDSASLQAAGSNDANAASDSTAADAAASAEGAQAAAPEPNVALVAGAVVIVVVIVAVAVACFRKKNRS